MYGIIQDKNDADKVLGELYDLDLIDYDTYQEALEKVQASTQLPD